MPLTLPLMMTPARIAFAAAASPSRLADTWPDDVCKAQLIVRLHDSPIIR
jgi:hypothetical protein